MRELGLDAARAQCRVRGRGGPAARVDGYERELAGLLGPAGGALVCLFEQGVPGLLVVAEPASEAPAASQQPGRAVERDAGGLGDERAGARERRDERGRAVAHEAVPRAGGEHGGGVVRAHAAQAVVCGAP